MKKLSVIILSLMLVILTCPAALADQTEPAADYTSTQFFLNPSALNSPCQAWYAWTWGNSSGRWVKGDKDGENYRFAELDSNIVFAGMYSDAEPSWDKSVMWNQTTDLCYDGVNNLFTPYQLDEDGKLTGIWSTYEVQTTEPIPTTEPSGTTEPTTATVPNPPTDPSVAGDTNPPTSSPSTFPTSPTWGSATTESPFTAAPTTVSPTAPTSIQESDSAHIKDTSCALNLRTATVKCGKRITLTVSNKNGKTPKFKSSNSSVAKVGSKGVVTALKRGFAKITATVGKSKLNFTIKVTSSPKLSKTSVIVRKGKTTAVRIVGKAPNTANSYSRTKYARISSRRSAARLRIVGLRKGRTTLRVRVNGVLLKLRVYVK